MEFPYDKPDPAAVPDARIWARYEQGFGDWDQKIAANLANLKKLSSITVDVGEQGENAWIPVGCRYVSQLLKAKGVKHQLVFFSGNHGDHLRDRLENHMLPILSQVLESTR